MPARKRNLVLLSHRDAVDLAPDSADKRAVVECANARFVLLNGDITQQNMLMLSQLHQDVARMPARVGDDVQRLRVLAFALRLTAQVSRLRKERDQIMEAAFRFARIAHFRQTGVRVGDLFDPIAEQEPAEAETGPVADAQGSELDELQPGTEVPGGCREATTTPTAQLPRQAEQEPTPAETNNDPVANNADTKPASNRQIKEYLHYLKRHRVNGQARENFRRRAQAEGWDKLRLSLEAHKLTAA